MLKAWTVRSSVVKQEKWLQYAHEGLFAAPLGFEFGEIPKMRRFQIKGMRVP